MLNFEAWCLNNIPGIKKSHFATARRRQTSAIALGAKAIAFCLKTADILQTTDMEKASPMHSISNLAVVCQTALQLINVLTSCWTTTNNGFCNPSHS